MPNDYCQFKRSRIAQGNCFQKVSTDACPLTEAAENMKLEYIADNTAGGKYPDAWLAKLIRLFDFDEQENQQLIALLSEKLFYFTAELPFGTSAIRYR